MNPLIYTILRENKFNRMEGVNKNKREFEFLFECCILVMDLENHLERKQENQRQHCCHNPGEQRCPELD